MVIPFLYPPILGLSELFSFFHQLANFTYKFHKFVKCRFSMIVNGYTVTAGSMLMVTKATLHDVTASNISSAQVSRLSSLPTFPNVKYMCVAYPGNRNLALEGKSVLHLSASSASLLQGEYGRIASLVPTLPRQTVGVRAPFVPHAAKDVPSSFRYPPMTKKPKWWWRTLACIPYLMPLHETWMYAETAYQLHPFLEEFEFLTYPFLGFIGQLPGWFLMAYFFVAYLGIVRKKEWPHFFRFHVVVGMLLEIALQVLGTVSRWMPLGLYWGKAGMHFWTAIFFGFLFTVLECMRCALAGMYADVPFVCDAAYIQIPYD